MINGTAIILAGGKSSRMGTDKLLLEINGKTFVQKITELCKSVFKQTVIVTNVPENYEFLGVEMFGDVYKNFGPLSGVHSGLLNAKTEKNFIVSADMPFVNRNVIEFLFNVKSSKKIVLLKSESKAQPLCGIYKKSCIKQVEELLIKAEKNINAKGKTKIKLFDLINTVGADIIDVSTESFYHPDLFFNMNTLEDYNYVKNNIDKIMIK